MVKFCSVSRPTGNLLYDKISGRYIDSMLCFCVNGALWANPGFLRKTGFSFVLHKLRHIDTLQPTSSANPDPAGFHPALDAIR